jgi:hypothetical protein
LNPEPRLAKAILGSLAPATTCTRMAPDQAPFPLVGVGERWGSACMLRTFCGLGCSASPQGAHTPRAARCHDLRREPARDRTGGLSSILRMRISDVPWVVDRGGASIPASTSPTGTCLRSRGPPPTTTSAVSTSSATSTGPTAPQNAARDRRVSRQGREGRGCQAPVKRNEFLTLTGAQKR